MQKIDPIETYNLSFTAGGLLYPESMTLIDCYLQLRDWSEVRSLVNTDNLLAARTASSGKRVAREIELRLSWLDDADLKMIKCLRSNTDQKQALWVCICRTYRYVFHFMRDVVFDKINALNYFVTYEDYNRFYNSKSQWQEELDSLSPSTQKKLRQVLFKMLRDMEILSSQDSIQMHNEVKGEVTYLSEKCDVNIKEILPAYIYEGARIYA